MTQTCTSLGCTNPIRVRSRGLCTKHWQRRRSLGTIAALVDATPVHEHLQTLKAAGVTRPQIAQRAGIPIATVQSVARPGRHRHVTATTAARILAVTVTNPALAAGTDGTGTRRRLQALCAIGWTRSALARHLGWSGQYVGRLLHADRVEVATAARVAAAFAELHATPGLSTTSVHAAELNGWALPMEWDDIDDPTAEPIRARRENVGQQDAARDRRDAIAEWLDLPEATRCTVEHLALELNCTTRTIERDKARVRAERDEQEAAA